MIGVCKACLPKRTCFREVRQDNDGGDSVPPSQIVNAEMLNQIPVPVNTPDVAPLPSTMH